MTQSALPITALPDWRIPVGNPRRVPSEQEIVDSFDHDTRIRFAYASQFLARLLLRYIHWEVCIPMKYRRLNFKRHCRELQSISAEFERKVHRAFSEPTKLYLDDRWQDFINQWHDDKQKLYYATRNNLIKLSKDEDFQHEDVAIGASIALAVINRINRHGKFVADKVNERAKTDGRFTPSPDVVSIQTLLSDVLRRLGCYTQPSQPMLTGIDVFLNNYLKIIKANG